ESLAALRSLPLKNSLLGIRGLAGATAAASGAAGASASALLRAISAASWASLSNSLGTCRIVMVRPVIGEVWTRTGAMAGPPCAAGRILDGTGGRTCALEREAVMQTNEKARASEWCRRLMVTPWGEWRGWVNFRLSRLIR